MLSFNFGNSCKFFILASSPSFLYLPTSVGHTPLPSRPSTPSVVHPHARGAYQLKWRFWTPYNGSSPPTWGIQQRTPSVQSRRTVHPHIRGAYMGRPAKIYVKNGSSPPTWGIPKKLQKSSVPARFIPTYVGHTVVALRTRVLPAVHPHLRGAYTGPP